MHKAFYPIPMAHGVEHNNLDRIFGSRVTTFAGGELRLGYHSDEVLTHFIYCHDGEVVLDTDDGTHSYSYPMTAGMYACAHGKLIVDSNRRSSGFVVTKPSYKGMFMVGGPVEQIGRLRYIDGCTDSLLIPPVMLGDPCFNLLHFPPGIDQTVHTHPSVRIGMVISGRGLCRQLDEHGIQERFDLFPGQVFSINEGGAHAFSTPYGAEMRVVAYHPDSDFGPTHESHPMLNRTIIDGISASDEARAKYRTY